MTAAAHEQEVACPVCGGRMWDNRDSKRNPRAPDFKCRDKSCEGVIWPPKNGQATRAPSAAPAGKQPHSIGALPGVDDQGADEAAFVRRVQSDDAPGVVPPALVDRYRACLKAAYGLCASELEAKGIAVDAATVQAMSATLLIQWSRG